MKVNRQPQKLKIENRKQYTKEKDFGQTAKVHFYTYLIFESCDGRYRAKMLKYPQEEDKGKSPYGKRANSCPAQQRRNVQKIQKAAHQCAA